MVTEKNALLVKPPVSNPSGGLCGVDMWKRAYNPGRNLQGVWRRPLNASLRFESLDGLRSVAFLWVIAFHCRTHDIALTSSWLPAWLCRLIDWGDSGVTLFLVLSGFLLTHIMLSELKRSEDGGASVDGFLSAYGRFLFRRSARIYPTLLFAVILVQSIASAVAGYDWWSGCDQPVAPLPVFSFIHVGDIWHDILKHAMLVANYEAGSYCMSVDAPWTVSFEMQCYVVFPLVAMLYSPLLAATVRTGRFPRASSFAWILAPAVTLTVYFTSVWLRAVHHNSDSTRSFQYLMCEYAAGVLAYLVAGPNCLDWINASTGSPVRKFDRPLLFLFQGLFYISCFLAVWIMYAAESSRFNLNGRALLSGSTALFIVCSCGFACGRGSGTSPLSEEGEEEKEKTASATEGAFVRMRQAQESLLSLPLRWLIRVLSCDCLFPLASVSYTSYLMQGIPLNMFYYNNWRTPKISASIVGLSGSAEFAIDVTLFGAFCLLIVAIGLLVSLTVERPLMTLLYPLSGQTGQRERQGRGWSVPGLVSRRTSLSRV